MKRVLIDTNFFFVPFQLGVNIFSEFERIMCEPFELMTLSSVKSELERLTKSAKGQDRSSAQLAVQLARNIRVELAIGSGDQAIINFVKAHDDIIVATNDSDLRKKLKSLKVSTIFVRGRKKLEIE